MNELTNNPAFLYGESVFTTCLVENGEIQLWKEHLDQLLNNAMKYYFLRPSDRSALRELVLNSLQSSEYGDGDLRISITSKNRDQLFAETDSSNLVATVNSRAVVKNESPLKLKVYKRTQDSELDELKVGSYGKEIYLKKLAMSNGFDEVLFCDDEKVYEASTSNIFFVKDNQLITPATGIYKGIIREIIIEENNVEVRDIKVSELDSFDGAFLTNSISIISSVSSINQVQFKMIGDYPVKCVSGLALRG